MLPKLVGLLVTSEGERGRENKSVVSRDRIAPTAAAALSPKLVFVLVYRGGEKAAIGSIRDASFSTLPPSVWMVATPPGLRRENNSVFSLLHVSDRESLKIAKD